MNTLSEHSVSLHIILVYAHYHYTSPKIVISTTAIFEASCSGRYTRAACDDGSWHPVSECESRSVHLVGAPDYDENDSHLSRLCTRSEFGGGRLYLMNQAAALRSEMTNRLVLK
jgi:hypothetical protein